MTKTSDSHIFGKIDKGDHIAFSRLFDDYYEVLCFFANKYISDLDLSRSLVQQVFVDLWTKRGKLSVKHSPKSYLFNAVKNRSIDYLRKKNTNVPITASHENVHQAPFHDLLQEAELNKKINDSINALPEKCRSVFLLCRFEGLKYIEIAEKLDISIKTVEMQMGIAMKKLRKNLSD